MSDLISIVLPVYNGARFLRDSIDSVIAQTHQNWELLILDDCSTDETPDIAKEYQAKDSRIHYHRNKKNLKLPGNLNKGFSLAKGDYLTWTSDDNRFRPNALARMLEVLREKKVSLVCASYQVIDEEDKELQIIHVYNVSKGRALASNVIGACFLYTREVYEAVGDYDTQLFLVEDWDFWQRVIMKFPFFALDETLYDYRWHDASLTSTKNLVRFGEVSEKMLLKNGPGFGKLTIGEKHGYYSALYTARKNQGGRNPYAFKYWMVRWTDRLTRVFRK